MSKVKAVDYFDRHPSSNECHITSDGRVFHTIGTAQGFANGLKNNKIETYKRGDLDVKNVDVIDPKEETGKTDTAGDDKTNANNTGVDISNNEALKAFDFENAKYPEAKQLAVALGLQPASQKMPDILEALKTAKANLEPKG